MFFKFEVSITKADNCDASKASSGFVRQVMDANPIFFLVCLKTTCKRSSLKLLFDTQPACIS